MRHELGHSLNHYLPVSWSRRWWRVACVCLYSVGGLGVFIVLMSKLWNVFRFILSNT